MSEPTVAFVTRIAPGIVPLTWVRRGCRALNPAPRVAELRPMHGVDAVDGGDDASLLRGHESVIDGGGRGGARVSKAGGAIGGAVEDTMPSSDPSRSKQNALGIQKASGLGEPS